MEKITDSIFKLLRLDNLVTNLSGYLEARMELLKIEIREDVANLLAKGLIFGAIGMCGFLFLIFFSVGLAHFLNQYLSVSFAGYWVVAGLYAVVLILFILFRNAIAHSIDGYLKKIIKHKSKQ